MANDDKIITILISAGFTTAEAKDILSTSSTEQIAELEEQINSEIKSQKPEPKSDGFINALILAGFSSAIATGVAQILSDDEEVIRLILAGQTPLLFMTKQDSKVDDKICLPKQGEVWAKEDPRRPRIPLSLHKHCRCMWQDPITGRDLGQF